MDLLVYLVAAALVAGICFVVFRVLLRRDYRRRGRLAPLSALLEYVAVGSWVTFGYVNITADWPAVHVLPALEVVGWTLFAGGFVLLFVNIIHLGILRSHGQRVTELEQSGFYGWSRNPQIVVFLAGIVGYVLLWPNWRNAGVLVLVGVLAHMMVLTEEEHLEDVFGDEYRKYRERVPRYVRLRRLPT